MTSKCSAMEVSKDPSSEKNTIPTVIFDGTNRSDQFQITYPIGKSNNGMVQVYKATWISTQHVSVVAIKCVNKDRQPDAVSKLICDVKRNRIIPDHPNIIGIIQDFDYKNYYCTAFPLMEHSLRSIMHARFSKGFPEECIVVALKETLNALYYIHKSGDAHLELDAGNIFFNGNEIKIAYSTSVYHESQDESQPSSSSPPSYMPMGSVCEWAVAPNGLYKDWEPSFDVWMIGITAIELAYGGLRVSSRKDLKERLLMVEAYKEIPARGIDKTEYKDKMLISKLIKRRKFSKAFEDMVTSCLCWWPTVRPTIEVLLGHEVFTECNKDVNYFARVIGD